MRIPVLLTLSFVTLALAGCTAPSFAVPTADLDPMSLLDAGALSDLSHLDVLSLAGGAFTLLTLPDAQVLVDDTVGTGDLDAEVLSQLDTLGVSELDSLIRSRADVDAPVCRELFSGIAIGQVVMPDPEQAVATAQGCASDASSLDVLSLAQAAPTGNLPLSGDVMTTVAGLDLTGNGALDGILLRLDHGAVSSLVPGSLACDVPSLDAVPLDLDVDVLPMGALGPAQAACADLLATASPALAIVTETAGQGKGLLGDLLGLAGGLGVPVHAVAADEHVRLSSDGATSHVQTLSGLAPLALPTEIPDADSVVPTVKSLTANPTSVLPGQTVEITAVLSDAQGHIQSAALSVVPVDVPDADGLTASALVQAKETVWTISYTVPADAAAGAWETALAAAYDSAGNTMVSSELGPLFTVLDTADALVTDALDWATATKELVSGEALTMVLSKDLPAPVSTVTATLEDPTGAVHELPSLEAVEDAAAETTWVYSIDMPVDAPVGVWEVTGVTPHDAAGKALGTVSTDMVFAVVAEPRSLVDVAHDAAWIEVANPTDQARDLSGWTLGLGDDAYTFADGFSLPAGDSIKVYAREGMDTSSRLYAGLGPAWDVAGGIELASATGVVDALAL